MRKVPALLGLVLLVGAAGCPPDGGRFNLLRPSGVQGPLPADSPTPVKEDLVAYLNNISANNPGIQSEDIGLTCYSGGPIGIPLSGKIRAQGPRSFRMVGRAMGSDEVDLGSNDKEFWYWIRRGDRYQFFCSYQAIEEGNVKHMPFPFQPDWVLEAMGMGKYGPAEKYELIKDADKIKLVERTKSPQGIPVKKVIVFNSRKAKSADQPQITDFLLLDDKTNKLICSAHISRRQIIGNKVELPRELELSWPEQNFKLALHLDNIQLNKQIPPQVFVRSQLQGVPSFDLASGRVEGMQQAGGKK